MRGCLAAADIVFIASHDPRLLLSSTAATTDCSACCAAAAHQVYSFGLVAWEISHGKKPFLGLNVDAHRRVVCMENGRPDVDRSRPREFAAFLEQCWHPDPHQRPAFRQILSHIRELAAGLAAPPQQPFSVMRRFGLSGASQ